MADRILKSIFYLAATGGLGYVLMLVTAPSEAKKKLIKDKHAQYFNEEQKKKALFIEKIKEATTDTPIYLKRKASPVKDTK